MPEISKKIQHELPIRLVLVRNDALWRYLLCCCASQYSSSETNRKWFWLSWMNSQFVLIPRWLWVLSIAEMLNVFNWGSPWSPRRYDIRAFITSCLLNSTHFKSFLWFLHIQDHPVYFSDSETYRCNTTFQNGSSAIINQSSSKSWASTRSSATRTTQPRLNCQGRCWPPIFSITCSAVKPHCSFACCDALATAGNARCAQPKKMEDWARSKWFGFFGFCLCWKVLRRYYVDDASRVSTCASTE